MNIAVIGLGSMGKRRIRHIKELFPEYEIRGIDKDEKRRIETSEELSILCFADISDLEDKVDCVFVCTSPLSHSKIITDCLTRGYHVFTELNLVQDDYDKNIMIAKENKCTLFLSSTFLYREETRYIKSRIIENKKWNYIYHIGQYLPQWHPWESYTEFFIGQKRTNGCREILAIELPWLVDAFGEVEKTFVVSDKITGLQIEFDDNYMIQICHANGNKGVLIVDVVSPVAVRKFEAYAENAYISWNGTPDSINEYDMEKQKVISIIPQENTEHREGYSSFVVENAYKNEIMEFFHAIKNQDKLYYGFEQDKKILEIIDSLGA